MITKPNTSSLSKRIRDSGMCSRRDAASLIKDGKVTVNDEVKHSPCFKVTKQDVVKVNNTAVGQAPQLKVWIYHKPTGLVTTHKDPQGRSTVFDMLPKDFPKVISIGRLDINSEGILLLTNNGDFARFMELPANKMERVYHVRAFGKLDEKSLKKLEAGCTIKGIRYGKCEIKILGSTKSNHWIQIEIHEGKNREIRKMFSHIKLQVTRLVRIQYGPFHLGTLKKRAAMQVTVPEDLYEGYCRNI